VPISVEQVDVPGNPRLNRNSCRCADQGNVVFPSMMVPLLIVEQKYARLIDQTLIGDG